MPAMTEQTTAGDGRAPGDRSEATLRVATELRRQLTRRRTQISVGFLVALPFLGRVHVPARARARLPFPRPVPYPQPFSSP